MEQFELQPKVQSPICFDLVKIGPKKVQCHNRWNVFASKFDSTSFPHSERFSMTYIDKSPEDVRTDS